MLYLLQKRKVESTKKRYEETQKKQDEQRGTFEKVVVEKKQDLEETLKETLEWYNNEFDEKLDFNLDNVDDFVHVLQEKGHELTTDETFDNLTKKQTRIEERRDRLLMNIKIIKQEHLDICPFCGGFVNANKVRNIINKLDDNIKSLTNKKQDISKLKQIVEKYRENLRTTNLAYQTAMDTLKQLGGGEILDD